MPRAEFFAGFGLYHARDFLDADLRQRLLESMRAARRAPGGYWPADRPEREVVDERHKRRSDLSGVPPGIAAEVAGRFERVRPDLARHFGLEVSGFQPPRFMRYGPGDFYRAHRDGDAAADVPAEVRERRISAVCFVNGESEPPVDGGFGGGRLTFFGLVGDERGREVGLPLVAEAGLLVAFPPALLHSVTAVTHGERYAVATWYVGGDIVDG